MRISDWSSDVCSSDLPAVPGLSLLPTAGDLLEQSGIDRHGRSFLVGFRMLFEPTEIGPDQIAVAKGRNDKAVCLEIRDEIVHKTRFSMLKDGFDEEDIGGLAHID